MKKILSIVLTALISAGLTTIILFDHFTGQFPWSISDAEDARRTVIHSRVLNEDREVIVHLPRNYTPWPGILLYMCWTAVRRTTIL